METPGTSNEKELSANIKNGNNNKKKDLQLE
jgi:hypothetical protein